MSARRTRSQGWHLSNWSDLDNICHDLQHAVLDKTAEESQQQSTVNTALYEKWFRRLHFLRSSPGTEIKNSGVASQLTLSRSSIWALNGSAAHVIHSTIISLKNNVFKKFSNMIHGRINPTSEHANKRIMDRWMEGNDLDDSCSSQRSGEMPFLKMDRFVVFVFLSVHPCSGNVWAKPSTPCKHGIMIV